MSANNKKIGENGEVIDVTYGANGDAPAATGTEGATPTVTFGTETSYAANGGAEQLKKPSEVLSYSEWIAEEEKRQQTQKDATYKRAEEIRAEAEETARVNRERAGVDAQVSYAKNMAGYGAKAESAASMGLTGGGYSDYIDAKAYATHRAEVQSAKAREESAMRDAANAEADAKYQADVSYSANMSSLAKDSATYHENEKAKEEQEMRAAFTADISAGNYETREALDKALTDAGVTDGNVRSQILAQWDVWNKGELDTEETSDTNMIMANIEAGAYESREAAEEAARAAGITNGNIISQIGAAWAVWNKGELDTQHSEAAAMVLANIEAGVYTTREAAEDAARKAGITNGNTIAQIGATWEVQNNQETYDAFVADIAAGNYSTKEALEAELDKANISGNKRSQIIAKWSLWNKGELDEAKTEKETKDANQYASYESFSAAIDSGSLDTRSVDEAVELGYISQSQYVSLKSKWNDSIDTTTNFFYSNGTLLSKSAANEAMNKVLRNSWCDANVYNALTSVFDKLYSAKTSGVRFNPDGNEVGGDGANFSVKKGDTIYRVQSAGEVTDSNIKEIASGILNDTVFGWNNVIYVKRNNRIYKVEERDNSYEDHYSSLYKLFF